jgi:hypothetical protein
VFFALLPELEPEPFELLFFALELPLFFPVAFLAIAPDLLNLSLDA